MKTITEEYRAQQQELHKRADYGTMGAKYAPIASHLIDMYEIDDMLDYGAGKGSLIKNLACDRKVTIQPYDPAIPEWADPPQPRQLVTCIDVLEHIEPDLLDNVLDDLQRCTLKVGLFTVHTGPAVKTLPDGRNAHLTQQPMQWWLPKIWERFDINVFQRSGPDTFYVVVVPSWRAILTRK